MLTDQSSWEDGQKKMGQVDTWVKITTYLCKRRLSHCFEMHILVCQEAS